MTARPSMVDTRLCNEIQNSVGSSNGLRLAIVRRQRDDGAVHCLVGLM